MIDHDQLVAQLHRAVAGYPYRSERLCLLYSILGAVALQRQGTRALVQAGSASWLFKAPAQDDGGPTHYSYVFDPTDWVSRVNVARGGLPEIHCWIGLPDTQELFDPTTLYLPSLFAQALPQEKWTAAPPDYFWGPADDLPEGWRYAPTLAAIGHAHRRIEQKWPGLFTEYIQRNAAFQPA